MALEGMYSLWVFEPLTLELKIAGTLILPSGMLAIKITQL